MRVLILGASGYAGSCIRKRLKRDYPQVYGTYHRLRPEYADDPTMFTYEMDDADRLRAILCRAEPDTVVSCLVGGFPQQLAAHREAAAYLARKPGGRMLYLSTANVFDGAAKAPHTEADAPKASSKYGQFKIACETLLRDTLGENCTIIRIPEIWGIDCPRIKKLIQEARTGTPIPTYRNLYVNYTTNMQIAEWAAYILAHRLYGIFHVGTDDICEYVEFQRNLMQALGLPAPGFQTQELEPKCYQAVLPGRAEIPPAFHFSISDVIRCLAADPPRMDGKA